MCIRDRQKIAKGDDANGFYPNLSVNQLLELTEKGLVGSFLHVVTAKESQPAFYIEKYPFYLDMLLHRSH